MQALADQLNLNISTVSRALDPRKSHLVAEETRLRILRAAEEAGYTPDPSAAGLRRGQTFTVGVLAPDLGNDIIISVVRSITTILDRLDRMPLIAESMDDPTRTRRLLERFRARRVDALVVLTAIEADRAVLAQAAETTPVLLAVRKLNDTTFPMVTCDDVLGGSFAAHHLADLGHRRVAQLRGPGQSATFVDRSKGFEVTCAARGVSIVGNTSVAQHATAAEGRRVVSAMLRENHDARPTAIFAHNDALAFGAFTALREHGLSCPEDISLIGYNDTPLASDLAVPLTSIHYPANQVGSAAGEMTMRLVAGMPLEPRTVIFRPELVVRASTTAPA
jgi:LacI family transcriptional regulator